MSMMAVYIKLAFVGKCGFSLCNVEFRSEMVDVHFQRTTLAFSRDILLKNRKVRNLFYSLEITYRHFKTHCGISLFAVSSPEFFFKINNIVFKPVARFPCSRSILQVVV